MRRLTIRPRAEQDLDEFFEYIARDDLQVAIRFLESAQATFRKLVTTPDLGSLWQSDDPRLADIRVWHIGRFRKHLIFYRVESNDIQIIRVLYGTRDIEPLLE